MVPRRLAALEGQQGFQFALFQFAKKPLLLDEPRLSLNPGGHGAAEDARDDLPRVIVGHGAKTGRTFAGQMCAGDIPSAGPALQIVMIPLGHKTIISFLIRPIDANHARVSPLSTPYSPLPIPHYPLPHLRMSFQKILISQRNALAQFGFCFPA